MGVSGFLKKVLEVKFSELETNKSRVSLQTIRRQAEETSTGANFLSAMDKGSMEDIGIIAEIKKASPSRGDIKPDLDPARYADLYTKGGARAISVLTESKYFKGSLKDLETVCSHTPLPVLRKDFIVSAFQIYEAKKAGAASVLLITTILSRDQLKDYILLARELGMEPLVEITSEREFETAYACGAKIVDINNRNLQTLETDTSVSRRIARMLPRDIIPVEASGISAFSDIEKGLSSHIFNFLVGESIVRAKDTESFIRVLRNVQ
jgi:indole-3-glycerol phosphate synthase/indole-3-glycerol phosphate synthase/phosphoribosylanthranilate isomerase